MSHPTRGAWIEILALTIHHTIPRRRTPHGVRGLKSVADGDAVITATSHPTRGAWIEISATVKAQDILVVAPHTGCVD